jgi:hypothetical protein
LMPRTHRRLLLTAAILIAGLPLVWLGMHLWVHPDQERAQARAQAFVDAVNYNRPANVYAYLDSTVAALATKEQFVQNWQTNREYPYISPLWLYIDRIVLSSDRLSGRVYCTVAARLPGMTMTFDLAWRHGDYYMVAFREIADGSFPVTLHRLKQTN